LSKRKVLIVDDSAVIRTVLKTILTKASFQVVGEAGDPYEARDLIVRHNPDVVTLDLDMPRMDGLTFLEKLMAYHPLPVVILSSLAQENSDLALKALELGAVAVVEKPEGDTKEKFAHSAFERFVEVVEAASKAKPRAYREPAQIKRKDKEKSGKLSDCLVVLGASLGGTEALAEVLRTLPPDLPGVLMVQHMPEKFTQSFARRLDRISQLRVKEAQTGDQVMDGWAYLAPGGFHLAVNRKGQGFELELRKGDPVNHVKPSVDVLFTTAAEAAGSKVLAALFTGMGKDGADGMLALRDRGAMTLAQDADSCVVYGMPKEAVAREAVVKTVLLSEMAETISREIKKL
jgi:two-component system chemotaxis response regulator CheB